MSKQKRFFLSEEEIPTQWYNIQADMPNKPMPMLDPKTKKRRPRDSYYYYQTVIANNEVD